MPNKGQHIEIFSKTQKKMKKERERKDWVKETPYTFWVALA